MCAFEIPIVSVMHLFTCLFTTVTSALISDLARCNDRVRRQDERRIEESVLVRDDVSNILIHLARDTDKMALFVGVVSSCGCGSVP
ncbi:hypothetical protein BDV97DRAFT_350326 [Delphinella strobiligena]|nr:hypothetical protein BDV97DRAFT_350326 [Delphinella strobiligena]